MSTDQLFWDDLLDAMAEGQVVPFIGRDLLVIETETGPRQYHEIVADHLAQELGIDRPRLPERFGINDVVAASRSNGASPVQIRRIVNNIVNKKIKPEPPKALRQLAEIDALQLFVSTTFDTLLEQALTSVRGRPAFVVFPSQVTQTDFDEEQMKRAGSFVFYLLGQACHSGFFTVTEGDALEQMHDLMSERQKWDKLGARLSKSHLLILGVSFPDWLARFLIKLGRKSDPLWKPRERMEIVVDSEQLRSEFGTFIRLFSPESRLFTGGSPLQFVSELHRQWFERHPTTSSGSRNSALEPEAPSDMVRGSIFISYATEDRAAAFRLHKSLTDAGLEVWVDDRLSPGDEFSPKIERHIRECSAFVALLSRHTSSEEGKRYFFREWKLACREEEFVPHGTAFLFPVVIDDTPIKQMDNLPGPIASRTAAQASNGEPSERLVEQLRLVQRHHRKSARRREQV